LIFLSKILEMISEKDETKVIKMLEGYLDSNEFGIDIQSFFEEITIINQQLSEAAGGGKRTNYSLATMEKFIKNAIEDTDDDKDILDMMALSPSQISDSLKDKFLSKRENFTEADRKKKKVEDLDELHFSKEEVLDFLKTGIKEEIWELKKFHEGPDMSEVIDKLNEEENVGNSMAQLNLLSKETPLTELLEEEKEEVLPESEQREGSTGGDIISKTDEETNIFGSASTPHKNSFDRFSHDEQNEDASSFQFNQKEFEDDAPFSMKEEKKIEIIKREE
jgi:hypothetical protein